MRLEQGEPRYTLHAGRAWEAIAWTSEVARAIDEAGVFVFGTLAQRTPEGLASWRTAALAAKRCLRVCDLNLRPTDQNAPAVAEALDVADLLKLNDRELGALRDWFGWSDPLAKLRERPRTIAVTHGSGGSTLYGEGDPIEIPAHRAAPGGDNVGCGDAYLAILVHGLTLGWDLETSGRAASRWAAAVAGHRGATPSFSDPQIAALLEVA